jgi:3',5'-cyclic-AMP phosphodiesterase
MFNQPQQTMRKPYTTTITKMIRNLLWMSDLHLDQAPTKNCSKLLHELTKAEYDAALVTGDTAASATLVPHLKALAHACAPRPLFVVLGNHDFYGSSLCATQGEVRVLCHKVTNLHHLQDHGAVWLNPQTVLLGHHGWADARCGWGSKTCIRNPDHWCIDDFRKLDQAGRFELMAELGIASTSWIRQNLNTVLRKADTLIVATHVPAFQTSAHYNGAPCGPCHSPHYVHASLGGLLIGSARHNPQKRFIALSGHTHSEVQDHILTNLESKVAGTKRGHPQIQGILPL